MLKAVEKRSRVLSRWVMLGVILITGNALRAGEVVNDIKIGSASHIGAYHAFVENLRPIAAAEELNVINVSTRGSQENIRLLNEGKLDAALVQNDIAYYFYYDSEHSDRSFQAALPLFPEYFQIIVRKDSGILHVDSLSGKRIALGARESGSYRNAKDILKATEISYISEPVETLESALEKLQAGKVDAICYTGAALPAGFRKGDSPLHVLSLPDRLINKLTRQYPYFYHGYLPSSTHEDVSTVSLMAYLALSRRISPETADSLIKIVYDNWKELDGKADYQLISLDTLKQAVQRKPTPLHPSANRLLIDEGYLFDPWAITYYLFGLGIITLLVQYASLRLATRYDRLGNLQPINSRWRYQLNIFIQGLAVLVGILAVMALTYFLIMLVIRQHEENYAIANNLYNPFATMSIPDLMLWLWGWIGGYENGIFPRSTIGRILVVFPPLFGLFSILWFVFRIWRDMVGRKLLEQQGAFVTPLRNHILICGWNEKVRGIVFGLTTTYAPERKKIVVIAEIDEERPLQKYNFPKGMVYYYRGDSSDRKALESAHVSTASAALILAGEKKRNAKNIGSVLTTLAIKRINPGIFTAAELRHRENIQKFQACRIDALVFAETIVYRLAAQACFNPLAISWLFDMITHDEHVELYAHPVRKFVERQPLHTAIELFRHKRTFFSAVKSLRLYLRMKFGSDTSSVLRMDVRTLADCLIRQGISMVGVYHKHKDDAQKAVLVESVFSDGKYSNFVAHDSREPLGKEDVIIYAALEKEDIHMVRFRPAVALPDVRLLPLPLDESVDGKPCRILLVGELEKCQGVVDEMEHLSRLDYRVVTEDRGSSSLIPDERRKIVDDLMDIEQWRDWVNDELDVIIILAGSDTEHSPCPEHDRGESDAKTLILARYVDGLYGEADKPRVVAEMLGRNSRDLFMSAGVNVVMPRSLLVERLMTKMAYGYGVVSNYLMAVLALNDKIFLNNIQLSEGTGEWLGLSYAELYRRMPKGLHLLAISPAGPKLEMALKNSYQDFEQHYLACPTQADQLGYISRAGDHLLVLDGRAADVES